MSSPWNPDAEFEAFLPYGFAVCRSVITEGECDQILSELKTHADWQQLQFGTYKEGVLTELSDSPDVQGAVNYSYRFPDHIEQDLKENARAFACATWGMTDLTWSRMTAGCLRKDMKIGNHRDSNFADTARVATVVVYVGDRFEGGLLKLPGLGIEFKPRTRDAVIFFSEHMHSVSMVSRGRRYNGVFFLETLNVH